MRGHAALDLALGEALSRLAEDDRVLRLGFSNVRDYARERLGIGGSVAQGLVRLARELRGRPLLGPSPRPFPRWVPLGEREYRLARWIARAEQATCVELRREAQAAEKTQMCERGEFRARVPGRMVGLLGDLIRAARAAAGCLMPAGERTSTIAAGEPQLAASKRCRRGL